MAGRIVCLVVGHKYTRVYAPGSTSYTVKCTRCGKVDEDPPTRNVAGG
jgi:hypothetical protein